MREAAYDMPRTHRENFTGLKVTRGLGNEIDARLHIVRPGRAAKTGGR
jgi:hypothetical protein